MTPKKSAKRATRKAKGKTKAAPRKTTKQAAPARRVKRGSSTYRKAGTRRLVTIELVVETDATRRELGTASNYVPTVLRGDRGRGAHIDTVTVKRARFVEDHFAPKPKTAKTAKRS